MPQLIMAFTELERSRFKRLDDVKNFGVEKETIAVSISRPMMVPAFLFK